MLRRALVLILAGLFFPAGDAASGAPTDPVSVDLIPTQNDWTKICGHDQAAKKDICYTTRDFTAKSDQPPVLAFALYDVAGDDAHTVRFVLPLGLMTRPGFQMSIDKGTAIDGKFTICLSNGCFAEATINKAAVELMKKATTVNVTVRNQAGASVTFVVPLAGLGKAYAGPGKASDSPAVDEQQKTSQTTNSSGPAHLDLLPTQNDWTKICGHDQAANRDICYTTRDFTAKADQPPVLALAVYDVAGDDTRIVRALLPVGLMMQAGVRISIDKGATTEGKFEICSPNGCFAEAKVNKSLVDQMKKATTVNFTVRNQTGVDVTFAVPLAGFREAFDGPAIDPKVLEEQQQKFQAELEKRKQEESKKAVPQTSQSTAPAIETTRPETQSSTPPPMPARAFSCDKSAKRVGLVVGNSAYADQSALANPVHDADDVSAMLRDKLCFKVIELKDATLAAFTQKIGEFAEAANGADVALFYYSGHGTQFQQTNFLLPVDAKLANEYEAVHGTVSAQDVVAMLESRARFSLVFLDACRDNPLAEDFRRRMKLAQRSIGETRGLARMEAHGSETFIVFATRPNDSAADGGGRNSPFTRAFLENIATPGRDIELVMRDVTARVRELTDGHQVPQRLTELEHGLVLLPSK
jgi:invasion protein IalB